MTKRQIATENVSAPSGHFSQGITVKASGTLVFISGMTSRRPDGTIAGIGDVGVGFVALSVPGAQLGPVAPGENGGQGDEAS